MEGSVFFFSCGVLCISKLHPMYIYLKVILAIVLMGVITFLTVINPINKAFDILSITAILPNLNPALNLHITVIVMC